MPRALKYEAPLTTRITARITPDLMSALKLEATEQGETVGDVIRSALLLYIRDHQPHQLAFGDEELDDVEVVA